MSFPKILFLSLLIGFSIKGFSQTVDTLIDVGTHKLHFNIIKGEGIPIVFESGAGNDGTVWNDLLNPISQKTGAPLITYDRAGFGQSGIDTANISISSEVENLELALSKLGYDDRYFFVAHSLGGNYVMKFIANNEDKVKGAVFIDIVSPYFMTVERATYTKNLFADDLPVIREESIGFYHLILNYENTSEVMRSASKNIDIPLTVIGSGISPFEGKVRRKFIKALKRFALEKDNRKYVLAKKAEHYVFYDEPRLVIDEIAQLYKLVKSKN